MRRGKAAATLASVVLLTILFIVGGFNGYAQKTPSDTSRFVKIRHGEKGFEFSTADNYFLMQIQGRLQFRFATPEDQDPVTFDDFSDTRQTVFKINRARLKIGGHAWKPWIKYYWEYELAQSNLLDFRLMIERWNWLSFKVGQWKVEFTRERHISSGEQQMVDRSIVNRPFTVDRQQGIEIYGRLKGKGIADVNYWAAVLTGTGRGSFTNDDNALMYFGRLQWNFLGRALDFESCDLEIHQHPAAIVAFSALTNRSPYTRFSQAGGGSLEGYEDGQPGQFRVNQYNLETAFKYLGFSWQSELLLKEVIDKLDHNDTDVLRGYYVQAGYMAHQAIDWWPAPLEIAMRNALYRPNDEAIENRERETSLAFNWFFNGHRNKLTFETSYFNYVQADLEPTDEWRLRLQWDISL